MHFPARSKEGEGRQKRINWLLDGKSLQASFSVPGMHDDLID
jgi:hypothetical protein